MKIQESYDTLNHFLKPRKVEKISEISEIYNHLKKYPEAEYGEVLKIKDYKDNKYLEELDTDKITKKIDIYI